MGFFDFFKKKPLTHWDKLSAAYKAYRAEYVDMIFPGGINQADTVIKSLAQILDIELSTKTEREYFDILSIYSSVIVRHHGMKMSTGGVRMSLFNKYGRFVKTLEEADLVISFCAMNAVNPNFIVDSAETVDLVRDFGKTQDSAKSKRDIIFESQNPERDDFGYSLDNPVCTSSVEQSNKYLARLETEEGEKLAWLRTRSYFLCECNNATNVSVDEYQLYLYGEEHSQIYICPYARDSAYVPRGMKLNDIEDYSGDLVAVSKQKGISVDRQLLTEQFEHFRYREKPTYAKCVEMSVRLKNKYPDFSLEEEFKNSHFVLMLNVGIDMERAYIYSHKDAYLIPKNVENCQNKEPCNEDEIYNRLVDLEYHRARDSKVEGVSEDMQQELLRFRMREWEEYKTEKFPVLAREMVTLKEKYPAFDIEEYYTEQFHKLLPMGMQGAFEVIHLWEYFELKQTEDMSSRVNPDDQA